MDVSGLVLKSYRDTAGPENAHWLENQNPTLVLSVALLKTTKRILSIKINLCDG